MPDDNILNNTENSNEVQENNGNMDDLFKDDSMIDNNDFITVDDELENNDLLSDNDLELNKENNEIDNILPETQIDTFEENNDFDINNEQIDKPLSDNTDVENNDFNLNTDNENQELNTIEDYNIKNINTIDINSDHIDTDEDDAKVDAVVSEVKTNIDDSPLLDIETNNNDPIEILTNSNPEILPSFEDVLNDLKTYLDGNIDGTIDKETLIDEINDKIDNNELDKEDILDLCKDIIENNNDLTSDFANDITEILHNDILPEININPNDFCNDLIDTLFSSDNVDRDFLNSFAEANMSITSSNVELESTYPLGDGSIEIDMYPDDNGDIKDPISGDFLDDVTKQTEIDEGISFDNAVIDDVNDVTTGLEEIMNDAVSKLENSGIELEPSALQDITTNMFSDIIEAYSNNPEIDSNKLNDIVNTNMDNYLNDIENNPQDVEIPENDQIEHDYSNDITNELNQIAHTDDIDRQPLEQDEINTRFSDISSDDYADIDFENNNNSFDNDVLSNNQIDNESQNMDNYDFDNIDNNNYAMDYDDYSFNDIDSGEGD